MNWLYNYYKRKYQLSWGLYEADLIKACADGFDLNRDVHAICVYVSPFGTHRIIPVSEDQLEKVLEALDNE